jgi:hypothetical protein
MSKYEGLPDELVHIHHLWWPVKVRDNGGTQDKLAALARVTEKLWRMHHNGDGHGHRDGDS